MGYAGKFVGHVAGIARHRRVKLEIVKRSDDIKGFKGCRNAGPAPSTMWLGNPSSILEPLRPLRRCFDMQPEILGSQDHVGEVVEFHLLVGC